MTEILSARPIQAALASAGSFAVGAALSLLTATLVTEAYLIPVIGGALAMGLTAGVGSLFGTA